MWFFNEIFVQNDCSLLFHGLYYKQQMSTWMYKNNFQIVPAIVF